jgi:hypothetical protein
VGETGYRSRRHGADALDFYPAYRMKGTGILLQETIGEADFKNLAFVAILLRHLCIGQYFWCAINIYRIASWL